MNNEKANLIATLAHAANNLRNVTNSDNATNAILLSIEDLAKPDDVKLAEERAASVDLEHSIPLEEMERRVEGDTGMADTATKLELITAALREKYPACHCGKCDPIHVLVQLDPPLEGSDVMDPQRAENLAKIVTKPGADAVFVARAKELLAEAGYAIVTL